MTNGWNIFDLFDLIDSEKQGIYKYIYEDDEPNEECVGADLNVVYIDKIFINKSYRKLGIASSIIKKLPEIIRYVLKLNVGCIVLLSNPFEIKGKDLILNQCKNDIKYLIEFYKKNGFKLLEGSQYMYMNMDRITILSD